MASPLGTYGAMLNVEYRVVGVWNHILNTAWAARRGFANNQYIICAETYPTPEMTQGLMMDLSINRIIAGAVSQVAPAYLTLEAKGAQAESWNAIDDQIFDWYDRGRGTNPAQPIDSWSIGARGGIACFYRFIWTPGTTLNPILQYWGLAGGHFQQIGTYHRDNDHLGQHHDLMTMPGYNNALGMVNTLFAAAP